MCRKCKKILGKTETYEEHLIKSELCKITFEKLGPEDSACEICNFRCTSSAELKNHKKEHRDGKKVLCFYCDYKIDDWVRLRSHIERKHPEHGEKKHFCEECGKGFLFDHMMRDHKRKAHPKVRKFQKENVVSSIFQKTNEINSLISVQASLKWSNKKNKKINILLNGTLISRYYEMCSFSLVFLKIEDTTTSF